LVVTNASHLSTRTAPENRASTFGGSQCSRRRAARPGT
jgi:hypothetical protein